MPDQAVVIIHGMGEQRPMDFLRGFAEAALDPKVTVFSQPDPLSESFELRRLRVLSSAGRPPTFLYEYYWAHHMQGSTLRHLWPLVKRVFFVWPWRVSGSLQFIYWVVWILALYLGARLLGFVGDRFDAAPGAVSDLVPDFGLGPLGVSIAVLVFGAIQLFLVNYFGDVARYLDPKPHNIAIRQSIRSEALRLLDTVNSQHDRVIIVAHSLGSIVAMDVLGHLWTKYYYQHQMPTSLPQPALDEVERLGPALATSSAKLDEFREAQLDLWKEQAVVLKNPWRVTDFISIGSPLAHANLLLASRKLDLDQLQELRELPRCPPVEDTTGAYSYEPSNASRVRRLHHGAHFAFTRWTNLWFPSRLGVFGDWFGGRLKKRFGPGVLDIPVSNSWRGRLPLLAHTFYFEGGRRWRPGRQGTSIGVLRDSLDLDSKSWLKKL